MNKIEKRSSCRQTLFRGIKGVDKFGNPISLTYDGDSTYKTFCGGIFSIVAFIIVCMYSGVCMADVINRKADVRSSSIKSDILVQQVIDSDNFNFKFIFFNSSGIFSDYQQYFNVSVFLQVGKQEDKQTVVKQQYFQIQQCGAFNCLKFDKFTLYGDASNLGWYSQLQVEFQYCDQTYLDSLVTSLTCKSRSDIDSLLANLTMTYSIQKQQFDQDSFDAPLTSSIVFDIDSFDLLLVKTRQYKVKRSDLNLQDSVLGWLFQKDYTFFSTIFSSEAQWERSLAAIQQIYPIQLYVFQFSIYSEKDLITRTVYSLWDALSAVGGMYSFIFGVLSFFVQWIYSDNLLLDIIGDTFKRIKSLGDEGRGQKKKRNHHKVMDDSSSTKQLVLAEKAQSQINERIPFKITLRKFWCYKIHNSLRSWLSPCFKAQSGAVTESTLIKEALQAGRQEFEISNIIKNIRNMKLFSKVMFTSNQLQFLPLLKQNVVEHLINKGNRQKQKERKIITPQTLIDGSKKDGISYGILKNLMIQDWKELMKGKVKVESNKDNQKQSNDISGEELDPSMQQSRHSEQPNIKYSKVIKDKHSTVGNPNKAFKHLSNFESDLSRDEEGQRLQKPVKKKHTTKHHKQAKEKKREVRD